MVTLSKIKPSDVWLGIPLFVFNFTYIAIKFRSYLWYMLVHHDFVQHPPVTNSVELFYHIVLDNCSDTVWEFRVSITLSAELAYNANLLSKIQELSVFLFSHIYVKALDRCTAEWIVSYTEWRAPVNKLSGLWCIMVIWTRYLFPR